MKKTTIEVTKNVWKTLNHLKIDWEEKSLNDVIKRLLKKCGIKER